jgi:hypothetical protein
MKVPFAGRLFALKAALKAIIDSLARVKSVEMKFRRGTDAERAQAIAAARERIANIRRQSFRPDQAGSAAQATAFDESMIERLERGDAFTVPE